MCVSVCAREEPGVKKMRPLRDGTKSFVALHTRSGSVGSPGCRNGARALASTRLKALSRQKSRRFAPPPSRAMRPQTARGGVTQEEYAGPAVMTCDRVANYGYCYHKERGKRI